MENTMSKISSIKKSSEGVKFFKVTPEDFANNEISFCVGEGTLLRIPYDFNKLPTGVLKRLKDKVILTEFMESQRQQMLEGVPVSECFIHMMLATWILQELAIVYTNKIIQPIKKSDAIPLHQFVSSPDRNNIFFVVNCELSNMELLCVEVHPSKPIAYQLAWLNLSQVFVVEWQGPLIPLVDLDGFFSLSEEEFNRKLLEIEMRDDTGSDIKDYEEY